MKPEIKAQWVAALRSGEYRQGTGVLRDPHHCYCCLGVLCDLFVKSHPGARWDWNGSVLGKDTLPADEIWQWAGLQNSDPEVLVSDDEDGKSSLSIHNDTLGHTFAQIADAIEAQL